MLNGHVGTVNPVEMAVMSFVRVMLLEVYKVNNRAQKKAE
jgi:hypothetical protein